MPYFRIICKEKKIMKKVSYLIAALVSVIFISLIYADTCLATESVKEECTDAPGRIVAKSGTTYANIKSHYQVNSEEIMKLLLEYETINSLETYEYTDYLPLGDINKTEVYNDSYGIDYYIDFKDGESIHIEGKPNSINFYVAIRNSNGKYNYYDLGNEVQTFNIILKKSKENSLFTPVSFMSMGEEGGTVKQVVLVLRKK